MENYFKDFWTMSEIAFNGIEIWLVYNFFNKIFANEKCKRLQIGAVSLFFYITILNSISMIDGIVMTILSYLGTLMYAIFASEENITERIFAGVLPIIVVISSDFLTFSVSIFLDIFSMDKAWEPTCLRFIMNLIYLGISILFYTLMNTFYNKIWQKSRHSTISTLFIAIFMAFGILVVNFLIIIATILDMKNENILVLYIIFIGVIFLLLLSGCIYFFNKWSFMVMKHQERKMQDQYKKLKEEYYTTIQNSISSLEIYRHDIMKHFHTIALLLQIDKRDKALEYLSSINNEYSKNLDVSNYTDDDVLNAILSDKKNIASNNGIELRITADKVLNFPLSSFELCSMFDNLLDNAIEACQRVSGNKFIDLFILHQEEQMCIIEKNSYCGEVFLENGQFLTTKKEKINHGLGIKIIKEIVKKSNGKMLIELDNREEVFIVTIIMPIK